MPKNSQNQDGASAAGPREWWVYMLKGGQGIASNPPLTSATMGRFRVREVVQESQPAPSRVKCDCGMPPYPHYREPAQPAPERDLEAEMISTMVEGEGLPSTAPAAQGMREAVELVKAFVQTLSTKGRDPWHFTEREVGEWFAENFEEWAALSRSQEAPAAPPDTGEWGDDALEAAAILKLLADGEDMADYRTDARRLAKALSNRKSPAAPAKEGGDRG